MEHSFDGDRDLLSVIHRAVGVHVAATVAKAYARMVLRMVIPSPASTARRAHPPPFSAGRKPSMSCTEPAASEADVRQSEMVHRCEQLVRFAEYWVGVLPPPCGGNGLRVGGVVTEVPTLETSRVTSTVSVQVTGWLCRGSFSMGDPERSHVGLLQAQRWDSQVRGRMRRWICLGRVAMGRGSRCPHRPSRRPRSTCPRVS